MKNDTKKSADYYMSLPYTFERIPEPGGGWFVAVKELPGCMSEGETPEDTMLMIRDAMRGWIEVALEDGDHIPEPRAPESYSGKFVVRVPRSLHRELVEMADGQDVSLNQLVNTALAQYLGRASWGAVERPAQPAKHPAAAQRLPPEPAGVSGASRSAAIVSPAPAVVHPATQVADETPRWPQTKQGQRVHRETK